MNDKVIMDTTLTIIKNECDLLLHGSIESKNDKVEKIFSKSLSKYLELQNSIFKTMEKNGYYEIENVEDDVIEKMYSKHTSCIDD